MAATAACAIRPSHGEGIRPLPSTSATGSSRPSLYLFSPFLLPQAFEDGALPADDSVPSCNLYAESLPRESAPASEVTAPQIPWKKHFSKPFP